MGADAKVVFGSPAWLDLVRQLLPGLVAQHGDPGGSFSLCEVWVGAPAGSVGRGPDGRAAWHARIEGTACDVQPGEVADVDFTVVVDYEAILPFTRKTVADGGTPPVVEIKGDPRRYPAYFGALHDALVPHTA